jgi:oligopeptide transport system substrate-binding protein
MAVEKGYYLPATGGWLPPGMPGHSPGIGLPYDPERARELLTQAGYPDGRGFPTVRWLIAAGHSLEREYLLAQWREELGIEVAYEILDSTMISDALFSEPPHILMPLRIADNPDPGVFLRWGLHLPPIGWRNQTYTGLLEKARRLTDHNERLRLYAQADRILIEEAPIWPLAYWRSHLLVKPWIKCPASALGFGHWRDVKDIIIEPH